MAFKDAEIAGAWGSLDDAAFADGDPCSAHSLRELARQSNRMLAKGGLMFRWVNAINGADSEVGGGSRVSPSVVASHVIPLPEVPAAKKPGITLMRLAVRAKITNGKNIYMFVGTAERPLDPAIPLSEWMKMTGDGTMKQYTASDIPVRREAGELLSFYIQAEVHPDNDTLMNTGTYGTLNTGTVDDGSNPVSFTDAASNWTTTSDANAASGGHYVVFRNDTGGGTAGDTLIHQAKITAVADTDRMYFHPPRSSQDRIRDSVYEIYKLPDMRLGSIACYGQDRTVEE